MYKYVILKNFKKWLIFVYVYIFINKYLKVYVLILFKKDFIYEKKNIE